MIEKTDFVRQSCQYFLGMTKGSFRKMANRPSSELFLPKPSARRHEHESIEHQIITRINRRTPTSPETKRRQTLASLVEQRWTELHMGEPSVPVPEGCCNFGTSTSPAEKPKQTSTILHNTTPPPPWIESAKHNLRETSQTRATLTQKAADLYATASGIIPPYLMARLTALGVLDEGDTDPQFLLGLDPSEQIDQVKFFLTQLGRVLDRLSAREMTGEVEKTG